MGSRTRRRAEGRGVNAGAFALCWRSQSRGYRSRKRTSVLIAAGGQHRADRLLPVRWTPGLTWAGRGSPGAPSSAALGSGGAGSGPSGLPAERRRRLFELAGGARRGGVAGERGRRARRSIGDRAAVRSVDACVRASQSGLGELRASSPSRDVRGARLITAESRSLVGELAREGARTAWVGGGGSVRG